MSATLIIKMDCKADVMFNGHKKETEKRKRYDRKFPNLHIKI